MFKYLLNLLGLLIPVIIIFTYSPPFSSTVCAGEVRVGVLLPISGSLSKLGSNAENALKLATEEINSQGGIKSLRMPIRFVIKDWQSEPRRVIQLTERSAYENIPILIGTGAASSTILASKISQKYELPMIDCSSQLPEDILENLSNIYTLTGTISDFVKGATNFIPKKEMPNILLVYENTNLGLAMRDSIMNWTRRQDIDIIQDIPIHYGDRNVFDKIADILKNKRVVLFQASGETLDFTIMDRFMKIGFKPFGWVNMSAGLDPYKNVNFASSLSEGMITVSSYSANLPIRGNQNFVDTFNRRFGVIPNSVAGMYWNCAWLLKDILERSHSTDRVKIIDAIKNTDLQEDNASEKNIYLSGGIKFGRFGSNVRHRPLSIQIQDQQPKIVWPEKYQTDKWMPFH